MYGDNGVIDDACVRANKADHADIGSIDDGVVGENAVYNRKGDPI